MEPLETYFGPEGIFAKQIAGFQTRDGQISMAQAVAQAIESKSHLIAEAGTGTGKTFAYLVPALLSGEKIIVSTGTKTLQGQLFEKDLPLVVELLGINARIAMLKGRANYLCHYRMDMAAAEGRFESREMASQLQEIRSWARRTSSGDIGGMADVPEQAPIWSRVTSTADNCLGKECASFENCFVVEARKRAIEADLVVVNHHLLFADMAVKESGFGEVLPGSNIMILDEAHQVPEIASEFFGEALGSKQLTDLLRDIEMEYLRDAGDVPGFRELLDSAKQTLQNVRLALNKQTDRFAWEEVRDLDAVQSQTRQLSSQYQYLLEQLEPLTVRGKGLENAYDRLERQLDVLKRFLAEENGDEQVRWCELHQRGFALRMTPLDVAGLFAAQLAKREMAWIFTSATLSVNGTFDHFAGRLGLQEPTTFISDSPFDYAKQAILYSPEGMPDPSSSGFNEQFAALVLDMVTASQGRAFVLFTSHRALREVVDLVRDKMTLPLLVQGEAPKSQLLDQFRELGNAVLFGTGSFWEGVDVKGKALSLVIIDRLPFASPGDPVLKARVDAMNARGENAFWDYQVPQAVIALKQGVGRLIRGETDKGVMVMADPRLLNKGYGKWFIRSLPAMAKTRNGEGVKAFLMRLDQEPQDIESQEQGA